jgi:hypothetical protein
MKLRSLVAAKAALLVLCVAIPEALAQGKSPIKEENYGYVFKDDLLDGTDHAATGATLRVLPLGRRDRLLRPRLHFVSEMLRSVESM